MMRIIPALLLTSALCVFSVQVMADDNCGEGRTTATFMRSDLVSIKKNVTAMADALGTPPAPYAKESENWQLPTYACQDKSGFIPAGTTYHFRLTTDVQQKKLATEYQQKMMAAEAKGDMQEVMNISQQYQKLAMQQASANQNNGPIEIDISTNNNDSGTIDPGAVVRDGAGFIALRQPGDASSGTETVIVYFDRQALKNAHEAASFDESSGGNVRVPAKLAVINARININGPTALVDAMVKKLSAGSVLGQLSEKRTVVKD
ncbi:MAG TPA: hypothetical protein VFL15_11260 [Gammaproteobacteria bacterium]|nr:hypothetical protein [Gammaproteobacteria bacterium]